MRQIRFVILSRVKKLRRDHGRERERERKGEKDREKEREREIEREHYWFNITYLIFKLKYDP